MDTTMLIDRDLTLLGLLQLASPALPIGAYSYSEGLETLTEAGKVHDVDSLQHWLEQELQYGAIRLEAAVMLRAYDATRVGDRQVLNDWNNWLSAAKETQELREQSWQMGRALIRLLQEIQPQSLAHVWCHPCNFAIAFGLAAANWQISQEATILGYLHSWATNLINAGVKLIPLGQTAGQRLLLNLHSSLSRTAQEILTLDDDDLYSCGWGLALASMAHETQYTRLFRS
jgi:urease accessory protein